MAKFIADVITPLTGTQHEFALFAENEAAAREQLRTSGLTIRAIRNATPEDGPISISEESNAKLQNEVRQLRESVSLLESKRIGYIGAGIAGVIGVIVVGLLLRVLANLSLV